MTDRRRFTVSAPDWGHTHLTPDAVVAFVDDELAHGPHARAVDHLTACPDCAAEVIAQRQARTALRGATCPSLPTSLMSSLRAIPRDTELPPPPGGLAMTADGELVSVLRADHPGLICPAPAPSDRRPHPSRRMRFGAGAAVSGLALGAIALGVSATPVDVTSPSTGVFRGPVVGPAAAPARLELGGPGLGGPGLEPARPVADVDGRSAPAPQTFLQHGLG